MQLHRFQMSSVYFSLAMNVPSLSNLNTRRKALGMSFKVLAARSGVSEPTIKRMLGKNGEQTSFANVRAVAAALGVEVTLDAESDATTFAEMAAEEKARWIVRMVQGTSALESQAVSEQEYEAMVRRTVHELMAGSPRKLWSA